MLRRLTLALSMLAYVAAVWLLLLGHIQSAITAFYVLTGSAFLCFILYLSRNKKPVQ